MLHQQTSMCSPMSPILGAQNLIDNPSSQLLRSKSLNDISYNSLTLAPDLSVNFQGLQLQQQLQQRHQNNGGLSCGINPNLNTSFGTQKQLAHEAASSMTHQTSNANTCMDMFSYYDQDCDNNHTRTNLNYPVTTIAQSNNNAFNDGRINQQLATFHRDLTDNQCSSSNNSKQNNSAVTNPASSTNMFNICNPIVMNLNGVTEQIGNLHL